MSKRIEVTYTAGADHLLGKIRWLDTESGHLFELQHDGNGYSVGHGYKPGAILGSWSNGRCTITAIPTTKFATGHTQKADCTLTGRKVGKVKMELVEEGFPHLYHSLGEMMTWAGDVKGYRPHDWWHLPGGVEQFKAAEARHKNKRLRGEETDDESGLLHLVHEAFNAMAAAEVALRKLAGL